MAWSSLFYLLFNVGVFFVWWLINSFFIPLGLKFVPDYWNPDTLFDLGRITGGFAIEDGIFMFFVGGIAAVVYEYSFRKRIVLRRSYKPHIRALVIGLLFAVLFMILFQLNPIWFLIVFGVAGAIALCVERPDLIRHSFFGGVTFTLLYGVAFVFFLLLFPEFIERVYNLNALSGISFLGIPLEEFLYAFSFGLLWAPLYEYAHGEKCVDE